jgi:hypothetical protein
MAELLTNKVLFSATHERDQLKKIYKIIGVVNEENYPGYMEELPNAKKVCSSSFKPHSDNGDDCAFPVWGLQCVS